MTASTQSKQQKLEGGGYLGGKGKSSRPGHPLVGVVTVVLNGREQLEKTVASVMNQTYDNINYTVIDGGSVDGSVDLLRSFGDSIDHWISEPDSGIAAAFNKGIRLSDCDLIGILNAGDWYEPRTLSLVSAALLSHPEVDVVCGSIRFWEAGSPALSCFSTPALLDKETSVYHPTVFIRKSAYLRYGVYDISYQYAMDYELLLRLKRGGARFLALEDTLANMTLDGVSYENWYQGLKEVRRARSTYFPSYDVACRHALATMKNLVARGLKKTGLGSFYRAYWHARNEKIRTGRGETS